MEMRIHDADKKEYGKLQVLSCCNGEAKDVNEQKTQRQPLFMEDSCDFMRQAFTRGSHVPAFGCDRRHNLPLLLETSETPTTYKE